jgi:hypothetical protein
MIGILRANQLLPVVFFFFTMRGGKCHDMQAMGDVSVLFPQEIERWREERFVSISSMIDGGQR